MTGAPALVVQSKFRRESQCILFVSMWVPEWLVELRGFEP